MSNRKRTATVADVDFAIRPYTNTAIATLANNATRHQPAAFWRQIVAWMLVETGYGYRETAVAIRRDKPTVENARAKISRMREEDDEVRRLTDRLVERAREKAAERHSKRRNGTTIIEWDGDSAIEHDEGSINEPVST